MRRHLRACGLEEQRGNVAPQNPQYLQGLDLLLQRFSYLFCGRLRERPIDQQLDDLLNVKLIILGKAVIAAYLFRLQTLQDIGVICGAFLLGDGIVYVRAYRRLNSALILFQQRVEVMRNGLTLF